MKRMIHSLIFIMTLLILSSCGGMDSESIRANAIIDGDFLEIELNVTNYVVGGDHSTFFSKKDLNELKDIFESAPLDDATLTTKIVSKSFLMIDKTNNNGKTYHYMVAHVGESDDKQANYYYFSAPESTLDDDKNTVYIPHHLLKFDSKTTLHFNVTSKHDYEITGSEEDIYDFYNNIDMYDVEKEGNKINVIVGENVPFTGRHTKKQFHSDIFNWRWKTSSKIWNRIINTY